MNSVSEPMFVGSSSTAKLKLCGNCTEYSDSRHFYISRVAVKDYRASLTFALHEQLPNQVFGPMFLGLGIPLKLLGNCTEYSGRSNGCNTGLQHENTNFGKKTSLRHHSFKKHALHVKFQNDHHFL